MAGINISERAKTAFFAVVKEAKDTFKMLTPDLDVDVTPEGHLLVKLDNVGGSAKVPGAQAIAMALHAGNLGTVEG